jgi:ribonuclease D
VLKALTVFRDAVARERNLPHFKIFQDRTLLELAQKMPQDMIDLERVHGMSRGQIRRFGSDLLRLIAENRKAPPPRRPRREARPPEAVVNRYELLHSWRKARGLGRGVESDVILSRDAMWQLAHANPHSMEDLQTISGLGPWRTAKYGAEILQVLNGKEDGD